MRYLKVAAQDRGRNGKADTVVLIFSANCQAGLKSFPMRQLL